MISQRILYKRWDMSDYNSTRKKVKYGDENSESEVWRYYKYWSGPRANTSINISYLRLICAAEYRRIDHERRVAMSCLQCVSLPASFEGKYNLLY